MDDRAMTDGSMKRHMGFKIIGYIFPLFGIVFAGVPVAHAAVYFMGNNGQQIGTIDVPDAGQNKGKIVVLGPDGKEATLGGSGSCGVLCSILTADVKDGKAIIGVAVPGVTVADPKARLELLFAGTVNAGNFVMAMQTPELATASVGKVLGIVSADGTDAKIGLLDTKDDRTTVLVADMAQAKADIANLKAQLAQVQAALAAETKSANACRSETIPVMVIKAVGSGDWVVTPQAASPTPVQSPIIKQAAFPIQV